MVLVVISVQFGETKEREQKIMREELEREREQASSTPSSLTDMEEKGWLEDLLLFVVRTIKRPIEKLLGIHIGQSSKNHRGSSRNTTTLQLLFCCYEPIFNSKLFNCYFDLRDKVK